TRDKAVLHRGVHDVATRVEFADAEGAHIVGDVPSAADGASLIGPVTTTYAGDASATIDGLYALAKYLAPFPGRKRVIFLSEGFPVSLESNVRERLDSLVDFANQHHIAFYTVDAAG